MAIIESGTLGSYPAVNECLALSLSDAMGIDDVSYMMVNGVKTDVPCVKPVRIGNIEFQLYRHPDLLVPDTCRMWKSEYSVKTKYGTSMEYDDFNPCYLYAEEIYESYKRGLTNG